jgi:ubiquinone/menaquinone biosynthesis C-methylase UbiE
MEDGVQTRSYDLEQLDRAAEEDRLAVQARAALELELGYLRRQGVDPGMTLVDVGCGPGLLSEQFARMVPDGAVIGVDADPKLLDQARARLAAAGLDNGRFVQAWADATPIATDTADIAYARFLLQHLPKPVATIAEMGRVVKPGGRVMIVDTDDGGLVVHPEVEGLARLVEGSQIGQAAMGGDRHVGRKLRSHMHEAGLVDIVVDIVPFTSEMVGMRTFADICLGFKAMIVPPDHMAPEAVRETLARVYALADEPGAFAQTMAYIAIGRAP